MKDVKTTPSQIGTPSDNGDSGQQLSAVEQRQRERAALKSGLYVKSPNGLKLRYRKVRRLVRKMQAVMPWLDPADDPACRAWAELEILGAYAFADLVEQGLTNKEGDPRRLLGEFRMMRQTQLAYERDLGMTPASRMALRVGDSRGKALDAASRVQRLRGEQDGD